MPETTPLIKAALNLRVGAGFDVYELKPCLQIKKMGMIFLSSVTNSILENPYFEMT